MEPLVDVLIVGAGISGLSCARELTASGASVRLLDRSSGVGGRCASKAADPGRPRDPLSLLDFGPVFVHGDDPEFLAWVEGSGAALRPGWPVRVRGTGTPCQPQAFDPLQRRFGLQTGIRSLAESLTPGLDVVPGAQVASLRWDGDGIAALTAEGREFRGRSLVLALALEQARELLAGLGERQTDALLGQFASLPCLTLLASYAPGTPVPDWDLWYPEASRALLLVSNEGSKRGRDPADGVLLTVQARPGWSRDRLKADKGSWAAELLAETGALVGPWARVPGAQTAHRWRYGRLGPSDHLVRPLTLERPGSTARLGLVGDLFDPDGGLQGSWRSGRRLARRWLGEKD